MITKTTTAACFLYTWDGSEHQYGKGNYDNALQNFIKPIENIELEIFLENLLVHQDLISKEKIENIEINHTIFYDTWCRHNFSEKEIELAHKLGARLIIDAQRNFVGETLYQVLDRIRERPALWIGEVSISVMYSVIDGFFLACNGGTQEMPSFKGFNDFIAKHYDTSTELGWKNLILNHCHGNKLEALKQFYVLLDLFRNNQHQ